MNSEQEPPASVYRQPVAARSANSLRSAGHVSANSSGSEDRRNSNTGLERSGAIRGSPTDAYSPTTSKALGSEFAPMKPDQRCFVRKDESNISIVDLGGCDSTYAIKVRVLQALGLPPDPNAFHFFASTLSHPQLEPHARPLLDGVLRDLVERSRNSLLHVKHKNSSPLDSALHKSPREAPQHLRGTPRPYYAGTSPNRSVLGAVGTAGATGASSGAAGEFGEVFRGYPGPSTWSEGSRPSTDVRGAEGAYRSDPHFRGDTSYRGDASFRGEGSYRAEAAYRTDTSYTPYPTSHPPRESPYPLTNANATATIRPMASNQSLRQEPNTTIRRGPPGRHKASMGMQYPERQLRSPMTGSASLGFVPASPGVPLSHESLRSKSYPVHGAGSGPVVAPGHFTQQSSAYSTPYPASSYPASAPSHSFSAKSPLFGNSPALPNALGLGTRRLTPAEQQEKYGHFKRAMNLDRPRPPPIPPMAPKYGTGQSYYSLPGQPPVPPQSQAPQLPPLQLSQLQLASPRFTSAPTPGGVIARSNFSATQPRPTSNYESHSPYEAARAFERPSTTHSAPHTSFSSTSAPYSASPKSLPEHLSAEKAPGAAESALVTGPTHPKARSDEDPYDGMSNDTTPASSGGMSQRSSTSTLTSPLSTHPTLYVQTDGFSDNKRASIFRDGSPPTSATSPEWSQALIATVDRRLSHSGGARSAGAASAGGLSAGGSIHSNRSGGSGKTHLSSGSVSGPDGVGRGSLSDTGAVAGTGGSPVVMGPFPANAGASPKLPDGVSDFTPGHRSAQSSGANSIASATNSLKSAASVGSGVNSLASSVGRRGGEAESLVSRSGTTTPSRDIVSKLDALILEDPGSIETSMRPPATQTTPNARSSRATTLTPDAVAGTEEERTITRESVESMLKEKKNESAFGFMFEDDDELEDSTFLPGFGPSSGHVDNPGSTHLRPNLRVNTGSKMLFSSEELRLSPADTTPPVGAQPELPLTGGPQTGASAATTASSGSGAGATSSSVSGKASSVVRRQSFAVREKEKNWAYRPRVETMLDHLQDFFPEHDVDKPIIDSAQSPSVAYEHDGLDSDGVIELTSTTTPMATVPPDIPIRPASPPPLPPRRKMHQARYRKSIRRIARESTNSSSAVSRAQALEKENLLRRKSTKMFGNRVEEVTSDQLKDMNQTISDVLPGDDPENFSFKWFRGELIGRGTYGHVYLAFNLTLKAFMAVKQVELPKTRSDKEDERQQSMVSSLKAEIELLKDLEHPNIVSYLGMEETVQTLSIFLEYVPGGSVGRIVRTHGKFEEDVIKSFTMQILQGLAYLHSLGILHRDLKADNILTDEQGHCKISDFGTSKRSADIYANDANMSMQGSIFWMAPEVIHNFKQGYSAKADVWSLGCVCLEMFAGRRPWSDEEAIQAMFKLGAERLAPPVPDDVVLSSPASSFLASCLETNADLRPRASELMKDPFLELPPDWSFTNTRLYLSMAANSQDARQDSRFKSSTKK